MIISNHINLFSLYVYGGYETNEGILSDFCRIPSPLTGKPFCWATLVKRAPADKT